MPVSVFDNGQFAHYQATLEFTGRLSGGAPSDPKLVEGWLAKNLGISDEEQLRRWTMQHLAETQGINPAEASDEMIEAAIAENASEKKAQVFKRTSDGRPYIEPRHVKAMLKEATNIAYPRGATKWGQYTSKSKKPEFAGQAVGGKAPVDFVAEHVFVIDEPIPVADEIDGIDLAVGHIRDWKTGDKRSTLGYFEYVDQPTLAVRLKVLDNCLAPEQWARIWTVAEANGLGARRSQGCGQFVVTSWNGVGNDS